MHVVALLCCLAMLPCFCRFASWFACRFAVSRFARAFFTRLHAPQVEFFHGHSQMSESLYHTITGPTGCTEAELKGKNSPAPLSPRCSALLEEMSEQVPPRAHHS